MVKGPDLTYLRIYKYALRHEQILVMIIIKLQLVILHCKLGDWNSMAVSKYIYIYIT